MLDRSVVMRLCVVLAGSAAAGQAACDDTSASADAGPGGGGDGGGRDGGPPGPDGDPCGWAPVEARGPMAAIDLAVPGRAFELDLTAGDPGVRVTAGNGCAVTIEVGAGFDGAPGARVVPPDQLIGGAGGNSEYCGLASGADVSSGGQVEVGQLNVRYALFIGRGYAEATRGGGGPKAFIPFVVDAAGGEGRSSRPMVFWGGGIEHGGVSYGAIGVTEGTVQSYQEPEQDFFPAGPGQDAVYFGPAPDHAGSATLGTPVVGDEWVVVEHELDLRRDRGNPDGLNRLWMWTRDGALAGAVLDIPLTWDGAHDFAGDRVSMLDGLGYYWNQPATRTADDHVIYSHVAFAANRPTGQPIGPPPGFLTRCARGQ
ncbi:MAG: hypothetical protein KA297_18340 [Kofleriaceae bacterium]|nr:hypothetical protein [Kofleriaceae bacterium]